MESGVSENAVAASVDFVFFFLSELEGGPLEVSGHIQTMIPGRPGSNFLSKCKLRDKVCDFCNPFRDARDGYSLLEMLKEGIP